MIDTTSPWTITVELRHVNPRALHVLYGGRRTYRRARAAANNARQGHLGTPAPVLANRRRGWRRG